MSNLMKKLTIGGSSYEVCDASARETLENVRETLESKPNHADINAAVKKAAPRNLLDNSDFRNPVNQRGITTITNPEGYTIDRWKLSYGTMAVNNGNITIDSLGNTSDFEQNSEDFGRLQNKLCTIVVKTSSGVFFTTFKMGTVQNGAYITDNLFLFSIPGRWCIFRILNGAIFTFEWAALYEGEYTAETLPEYQPKGYGVELAECMRYYYRNYYGEMPQAGFASLYAPLSGKTISVMFPTPMRVTPTITLYNPTTGHSGCVADWATDADVIAKVIYSNEHNFIVGGDMTEGQMIAYNYEASADL